MKRKKQHTGDGTRESLPSDAMILREGGMSFGAQPVNRYEALELRCEQFARDVRAFVKRVPRTVGNQEDVPQLIRASGSVGANYIEANEALGKKDFYMKIKTSRKEAKESRFWMRVMDSGDLPATLAERDRLIGEATELMLIFAAIYRKADAS